MLSLLAAMRHGHYDRPTKLLSNQGRREVKSTLGQLGSVVEGLSTLVLFSTRVRCAEVAGIVQGMLNASADPMSDLVWDGETPREDDHIDTIVQGVRKYAKSYDAILLVTHEPVLFRIPFAVPRIIWEERLQVDHPCDSPQTGQIVVMPWRKPHKQVISVLSPQMIF